MASVQIAVINHYTPLTDAEVQNVVQAVQIQVDRDFTPVWGVGARLIYYPLTQNPPPTSWPLIILDNPDQGNDLGYHTITATGQPIAKVFAGTAINNGWSWTISVSHEVLEMLWNPADNRCVIRYMENSAATFYLMEVCDACSEDRYGYKINNIDVSNFVYPAWFQDFLPAGTQYDYCKRIHEAFTILSGKGNIASIYDILKWQDWGRLEGDNT